MDIARPDLKKRKQRRILVLSSIAAGLLLLAGFAVSRLEPAAPRADRASLWIDQVQRGELKREVRGPGTLVPKETRWIAAETAATVERILVKPGATVTPDTVILELTNPEVEDLKQSAAGAVIAAEADLAAQRMTLESQALDLESSIAIINADFEGARLQAEAEAELNKKGIVSGLTFKQTQLRAEQLKIRLGLERQRAAKFRQNLNAQMQAAGARIEQLRNTLALRERQAAALQLKAGIAGVLQQVAVEEGQQVVLGASLARVARPDVLMAELRIPETQAKDVLPGQVVSVDTRNGLVAGRVARVDPAVLNGTVQVDVDLEGVLPKGARTDLSVDGTIEIERLPDVLYVGRPAYGQPESAVSVFRLDADGNVARRLPVQLGRASVSTIEVVGGLNVGDRVILSDISQWDGFDRIVLR